MFHFIGRAHAGVWAGAVLAALLAAVGYAQWPSPAGSPANSAPIAAADSGATAGQPADDGAASDRTADDPTADDPVTEHRATDGPALAGRPADVPTAAVAAEPFLNPEQLAREFCEQLAARAKSPGVVSPRELVRQVALETTFPMQPLAPPVRKLSPEAIYARAKASVVIVGGIRPSRRPCMDGSDWNGSFATGFVVRGDGVILTNAHVIEAFAHTRAMGVMTHDGRVFPVTAVLAADRKNDVAAIQVEADDLVPLPIAADVPVGAAIYCLSHPALDCCGTENAFWTFTSGMVSGKFRLRLDSRHPVDALAITADYAQGSSGGPVLDERGAVVGMICHTKSLCAGGDPGAMQMTWKLTRPSSSILRLLGSEAPAAAASTGP